MQSLHDMQSGKAVVAAAVTTAYMHMMRVIKAHLWKNNSGNIFWEKKMLKDIFRKKDFRKQFCGEQIENEILEKIKLGLLKKLFAKSTVKKSKKNKGGSNREPIT